MFSVGEYVMKSNEGVCRIDSTLMMQSYDAERGEIPYYLLIPVSNENVKVYIPVSEEYRDVRPVMKKEEAIALLNRVASIDAAVIENDRQREQFYKEAMRSLKPDRLVEILKNMAERKEMRRNEGKKMTSIDERYTRLAEEALCQEVGFVLHKDERTIREEIARLLQK